MKDDKRCFDNPHFSILAKRDGIVADLSHEAFPTEVRAWGHERENMQLGEGTHFGFVTGGPATVFPESTGKGCRFDLVKEMYFCVSGRATITGGAGLIVTSIGYHGIFTLGGPIEKFGRLRYIDGCSDSLLIPPVKKGDPCLNFLHFPKGISQTRHTHPSVRIGIVARGRGRCVVPQNEDGSGPDKEIPLIAGSSFIIPAGGHHSFFTDDQTMDVVAYHPDSDTGSVDDDHPMVNRTIVDGKPASKIPSIQTAGEIVE